MKLLRFAIALLAVLTVLFGAILLSGQGVLFAVTDVTEPVTPATQSMAEYRRGGVTM